MLPTLVSIAYVTIVASIVIWLFRDLSELGG